MKNLVKLLTVVLSIGFISSCENNDEPLLNENSELSSRKSVEKLNLSKKFNINEAVYNEFIESLTFENGEFVGAIYDGIESELDDTTSDLFWSNFDISIRNKDNYKNATIEDAIDDAHIFEGYKPRRGGCRANNRWICVVRDY